MTDADYIGPQRRLQTIDYADPSLVFFVTIRAREGTAPFTDPRLAHLVIEALQWLRDQQRVRLYAYCLMPDHLHLLLQLSEGTAVLGSIIGRMKSFTTKGSWELGCQGQLWQGRFYDHVVRTGEDGRAIAQYILDNPVRKGLVEDGMAYRWSGLPDPLE